MIMKGRPYSSKASVPKVDIVNGETHTANKKLFYFNFLEEYIHPRLCVHLAGAFWKNLGAVRTKPNCLDKEASSISIIFLYLWHT